MKFDKTAAGNAFALAGAVLWTLCAGFVWLFPKFSLNVVSWLMHGMDISVMGDWHLTLGNFLNGGVTAVISAWVTGWVLAWAWERVGKKK